MKKIYTMVVLFFATALLSFSALSKDTTSADLTPVNGDVVSSTTTIPGDHAGEEETLIPDLSNIHEELDQDNQNVIMRWVKKGAALSQTAWDRSIEKWDTLNGTTTASTEDMSESLSESVN